VPPAPVVETIEETEPVVVAEEPADETIDAPAADPTDAPAPAPTATPVPPTATPTTVPPTATSTATPLAVAAIVEPPAAPTAVEDAGTPPEPDGVLLVAGSPLSEAPNPFVLFGTLLLALAAAAGGVLRNDPLMLRRWISGLDGLRLRRLGGASTPHLPEPAFAGGPASTYAYQTVAGEAHPTYADLSSPGGTTSSGTVPHTLSAHGSGGSLGGQAAGDAFGKVGSGGFDHQEIGGQGGLDSFAKGMPNGLDGHGFGGTNLGSGDPGLSHDVAGHASSNGVQLQHDAFGPQGADVSHLGSGGPSGPSGAAAVQPAAPSVDAIHNGLNTSNGGLGGSSGGDGVARGVGSAHDALGHASGTPAQSLSGHHPLGSSDALAHGANGSGHGLSGSGLGGEQAGANGSGYLAHGGPGAGNLAGMPPMSAGPSAPLNGGLGADAGLGVSLDNLAHALPPSDGGALAGAGAAPPGDVVQAVGSFQPSWLGAGALARAATLPPLPREVRCPGCDRVLARPHRFCGYCGEPLDKTII
jgi:hypothetical protein